MSKVALLGYGQFGAAFASLVREAGYRVAALDVRAEVPVELRAADRADLVRGAEVVVVAVPVPDTRSALDALRRFLVAEQLVLDVGSVKRGPVEAMASVLGPAIPWAATHPLFGPASLALGERPLRAVVCPGDQHPGAAARARAFYERLGCEVIEQRADEHDRVMADTHALTLFIAKGMIDVLGSQAPAFTPPSFQAIARVVDNVRADAGHLFRAIETENPFAAGSRRRFLDALARIHAALDEEPQPAAASSGAFAIPDLGARSPVLRKTRELIDDLDRELVELLARRVQLARRAGRAKASEGMPIRDPEREADLLAERRAWAGRLGLDPESVGDIFRAVLRSSRAAQRPRGAVHRSEGGGDLR